jgi:hypothetical protein
MKLWIIREHEIFKSAARSWSVTPTIIAYHPTIITSIEFLDCNDNVPKPDYLYLVWHEAVDDSKLTH